MTEADIHRLFIEIDNRFTFHDRLKKLAEECSEYVTAYMHYIDRGEEYLRPMIEEIAGVDFVLATLKTKILKITAYRSIYREIFNEQLEKCENKILWEKRSDEQ